MVGIQVRNNVNIHYYTIHILKNMLCIMYYQHKQHNFL